MRRVVILLLCLLLLVNGCKISPAPQPGEYPQPNWVERRLDRLETWNRHHGYPIEKTRDATKFVVACTVLAVGATACGVAYLILQNELDKQADPKAPHH